MEGSIPPEAPITAKRQKILDKAFAQLRKSRAKIDPNVLNKIRRMIAGNPAMMEKLGVGDTLQPKETSNKTSKSADMPLSGKAPAAPIVKKAEPKKQPKKAKDIQEGYEEVDQAKTMEIMAKLMALNPNGKEDIKQVIKKSVE